MHKYEIRLTFPISETLFRNGRCSRAVFKYQGEAELFLKYLFKRNITPSGDLWPEKHSPGRMIDYS
jgi:hypothetical protein